MKRKMEKRPGKGKKEEERKHNLKTKKMWAKVF